MGVKMHISKVIISNYRNFENFEIDLKPFTVLVGENNIGKSNIINAIGLVLSNEISFYKGRSLEIEDFNYNTIKKFKESIVNMPISDIRFPEVRVDIFLSDFYDNDEQLAVVSDWLLNDYKTAKLSYIYQNKNPRKELWLESVKNQITGLAVEEAIKRINFPIDDYEYSIIGGLNEKKVDTYFLKKIGMEILDALRDAKSELSTEGTRKLLYKILVNRDLEKYNDLSESIEKLHENISSNNAELGIIEKEIKDYLQKISLETETSNNTVKFRFSSLEINEILKKFGLEYGDNPISVDKNGLGRNNLLYISLVLSHLLSQEKKNYFKMIAIEEPESHLSPILQKNLAQNLEEEDKDKKRQLLVTSHSTHIISHLDIDNMVIIYKNGEQIKSHYILDNIDKKFKKYLKKWLNATNSTMFFSRRIILVEGIAEQILIPSLFKRHTGETLEKYNCQVINVNGVAFKNFLEIVKNGYFIKCAVLTDSDKETKTENRADDLKKDYESNNVKVFITSTQTFERDILESNKSGKYKTTINKTMEETRPILYGKNSTRKCTTKNIDVDVYFNDIEEFKSEFSFNLSSYLEENNLTVFEIPKYIRESFDFIVGSNDNGI